MAIAEKVQHGMQRDLQTMGTCGVHAFQRWN